MNHYTLVQLNQELKRHGPSVQLIHQLIGLMQMQYISSNTTEIFACLTGVSALLFRADWITNQENLGLLTELFQLAQSNLGHFKPRQRNRITQWYDRVHAITQPFQTHSFVNEIGSAPIPAYQTQLNDTPAHTGYQSSTMHMHYTEGHYQPDSMFPGPTSYENPTTAQYQPTHQMPFYSADVRTDSQLAPVQQTFLSDTTNTIDFFGDRSHSAQQYTQISNGTGNPHDCAFGVPQSREYSYHLPPPNELPSLSIGLSSPSGPQRVQYPHNRDLSFNKPATSIQNTPIQALPYNQHLLSRELSVETQLRPLHFDNEPTIPRQQFIVQSPQHKDTRQQFHMHIVQPTPVISAVQNHSYATSGQVIIHPPKQTRQERQRKQPAETSTPQSKRACSSLAQSPSTYPKLTPEPLKLQQQEGALPVQSPQQNAPAQKSKIGDIREYMAKSASIHSEQIKAKRSILSRNPFEIILSASLFPHITIGNDKPKIHNMVFSIPSQVYKMLDMSGEMFPKMRCWRIHLRSYKQPPGPILHIWPKNLQISIRVNNQPPDKLHRRAVDITKMVKEGANACAIAVGPCIAPDYLIGAYLVQIVPDSDLITHIGAIEENTTIQTIKRLFIGDDDDEVEQVAMKVSLKCPLSMCRISQPVRGVNCRHVQCFDLSSFLLINRQKISWTCPTCSDTLTLDLLCHDPYFKRILDSVPAPTDEVEIKQDGSFHPISKVNSAGDRSKSGVLSTQNVDVEELSSGDEEEGTTAESSRQNGLNNPNVEPLALNTDARQDSSTLVDAPTSNPQESDLGVRVDENGEITFDFEHVIGVGEDRKVTRQIDPSHSTVVISLPLLSPPLVVESPPHLSHSLGADSHEDGHSHQQDFPQHRPPASPTTNTQISHPQAYVSSNAPDQPMGLPSHVSFLSANSIPPSTNDPAMQTQDQSNLQKEADVATRATRMPSNSKPLVVDLSDSD